MFRRSIYQIIQLSLSIRRHRQSWRRDRSDEKMAKKIYDGNVNCKRGKQSIKDNGGSSRKKHEDPSGHVCRG